MAAVLFVVALSEYDMTRFEDSKTNRMQEALHLFKSCVEGGFFTGKTVAVFLNKYDLFSVKIKSVPITVAFPDYPAETQSPHDEDLVIKYIAEQFLQCFDAKPLHFHRTSALQTDNIDKVFRDITLDLVRLSLMG